MKHTKRMVSFLLSTLLLISVFSAVTPTGAYAQDAHMHSGTLQALRIDSVPGIPCCGEFLCDSCGETYLASVTSADVGLPVLKLNGSFDGISKDQKVTVLAQYDEAGALAFSSNATLKWQGATSVSYPKKNYNLQFVTDSGAKNKVQLRDAWGQQSKYCLKANWIDFSGARNVVSAKLWGEVVHSRCIDDPLDALVNGGAIDGYPIVLYQNDVFQGLYTLNTPKDNWIFGMNSSSAHEGLLFGETWTQSVMLQTPITDVNNPASSGWDLEYCATEEVPDVGVAWLSVGMNNLIGFLQTNDGDALKAGLGQYVDVARAIDYMLYAFFICAEDNTGKNILWATYDGEKYLPGAYDLDGTWSLRWNGSFPDLNAQWSSIEAMGGNLLFRRLLDNYADEIRARYVALREDVLSVRNMKRHFSAFIGQIPALVYAADAARWPDVPSKEQNNLQQLVQFIDNRTQTVDASFGVTVSEKTDLAWRAAFACENGAQVFVYPTQDYTAAPVRAASAFSSDGTTGALTKEDGQINFAVAVPEGYTASVEVTPASAYKNLKTPADTGKENTYRITKIKDDLTVRVRLIADLPAEEGWTVRFQCDPGVDVWVYPAADYTQTPTNTRETISVASATGTPTKTDGQVNFLVTGADELDNFEVTISPKAYKNLKDSSETGQANTYRITKISGDLDVQIHRIAHVHRWGEWKVVKQATRSENGLEQRVCLDSDIHIETRVIPKNGGGYLDDLGDFWQMVINWYRHIFNVIRGWFVR